MQEFKVTSALGKSSMATSARYDLSQACKAGELSKVQLAIKKGARPDKQTLTWACLSKNNAIIDAVIALGAKPDEETLTAACSTNQIAIIGKALGLGAKATQQTLEVACQTKNIAIIELIKAICSTHVGGKCRGLVGEQDWDKQVKEQRLAIDQKAKPLKTHKRQYTALNSLLS